MAVEAIDLNLRRLPPFTAVLWSQFESNPQIMYNLVEPAVRPGQNYHSDLVFDMAGKGLALNELKVESVEDMHRLTKDLLRMPLLFRAKVEHQRTDHYVVMKVRKKWKDEFAILVNTQHHAIREVLSRRLSEAMQYMQEGKKFCIKIGFGQCIRQWYSGIVDAEVTFCDSRSNNDNGNLSIYIHNSSTPLDCCVNPVCIICCFPFWLLFGGPCYLGNRKAKYIDVDEEVRDLPVTLVTGQRTIVVEQHVQQGQHPGQMGHHNPQLGTQYPPQYPGPQHPGQYPAQYPGPQQPGQYPAQYPGPQQPGQYAGPQQPGPHGAYPQGAPAGTYLDQGQGTAPPPYNAV